MEKAIKRSKQKVCCSLRIGSHVKTLLDVVQHLLEELDARHLHMLALLKHHLHILHVLPIAPVQLLHRQLSLAFFGCHLPPVLPRTPLALSHAPHDNDRLCQPVSARCFLIHTLVSLFLALSHE